MFTEISFKAFALIVFLSSFSSFLAFSATKSHFLLPKRRLTRILRPNSNDTKAASDLPSIARERYTFLKNRNRKKEFFAFIRLTIAIEDLLVAAGLKWRLSSLFIFALFLFLLLSALLFAFGLANFLNTVVFAGPASVFLTLQFLVRRRAGQLRKFQEVFPEALDLIVRSVRAGLPVSEAIKVIGAEVADPVGEVFREVAADLAIGVSLDEALLLIQKRAPIPETRFFVISLTIQQETGGNLAEILANLASMMRKRVQIGKKIRALSSEARASAVIIGSLPFLVGAAIFMLNREYIEVLYFDATGQLFLFAALGSIASGAVVMARLVRFEI